MPRRRTRLIMAVTAGAVLLGIIALAAALFTTRASRHATSTPQVRATLVDAFGARGDGKTDDIAAIRRAIAALHDGGVLQFSAGKTYLTSQTVEVTGKDHISIVATGATITTTASDDTASVLRVENCSGVRVVGGHLFHKNRGIRRNAADGLTINQCTDVQVNRVQVGYVYSMGIRVAGSSRVSVTDCTVDGSMADGIGAYGGQRQALAPEAAISRSSTILTSSNSDFRPQDVGSAIDVPGAGPSGGELTTRIIARRSSTTVVLAAPAQTTVTRQYATILRPSSHVTIARNRLIDTGDDAISSVSYLTYPGPNTDVTVQDNRISGSRARGVLLTGTDHAVVSRNTLHDIALAGVFVVVEVGDVTTWGSSDIDIDHNTMDTVNTGFGPSNYPGIGAASTSNQYPISDVSITDNVIRDAYSYYIGVGGYSTSNDSSSTRNITVSGNRCLGGNRNNPGIQVIKSTDVTITGNVIDDARTSAITVLPEVAGRVVVEENVIDGFDRAGGGFSALDIRSPSPTIRGNVVDGSVGHAGSTPTP